MITDTAIAEAVRAAVRAGVRREMIILGWVHGARDEAAAAQNDEAAAAARDCMVAEREYGYIHKALVNEERAEYLKRKLSTADADTTPKEQDT